MTNLTPYFPPSAVDLPAGAAFDHATRAFSWTPDDTQGGVVYSVTFTVSDGVLMASEVVDITVVVPKDDLVVDFGPAYGLYARYNDASWLRLSGLSPVIMTTGDVDGNGAGKVIAYFEGIGIWAKGNGTDWTRLHSLSAELMSTGNLDGN